MVALYSRSFPCRMKRLSGRVRKTNCSNKWELSALTVLERSISCQKGVLCLQTHFLGPFLITKNMGKVNKDIGSYLCLHLRIHKDGSVGNDFSGLYSGNAFTLLPWHQHVN